MFEQATIERYLGYFRNLLEAMVADDTQTVDRLPILGESERHRVLYEWNDTKAEYPSDKCVHELFEAQVEKTPDAVAVVFEDRQLSYAELNRRANRLAHHLRELGVKPDTRVALCVERGLEMIVALMAVLKAGGAYVPLDPAYPVERLRFMLADSTPVALLTQSYLRHLFADLSEEMRLPVLDLDDASPWREHSGANPDPDSIGSTPQPPRLCHLHLRLHRTAQRRHGRTSAICAICLVRAYNYREFDSVPMIAWNLLRFLRI